MEVNGRQYHVEKMSVIKTLEFAPEVMEAIGPSLGGVFAAFQEGKTKDEVFKGIFGGIQSSKLTAIMHKAIKQVITPENTYLRDAMVFESWFTQYPEDLFEVGSLATWELTKSFLPKWLNTIVINSISKVSQSASPKGGE